MAEADYDVVIVGGGPAGLSAALVLGRARRRVLLYDVGRPRNAASHGLNGYLSRDGIPPLELLRCGRRELEKYGVEFRAGAVSGACPVAVNGVETSAFQTTLATGQIVRCRKLLLATGVVDELPDIPGFTALYGRSVHHCPYCDGWEHRDQPLAAYGWGQPALGLALSLLTWSRRLTVCTDGHRLNAEHRRRLAAHGLGWRREPIVQLEAAADDPGRLARVHFAHGPPLDCQALFFNTGHVQRSDLPLMLGCEYDRKGHVRTGGPQRTRVRGLYLAGDADGDVQFAIVAAAEGATAAVAINRELQEEDRAAELARAGLNPAPV